MNWLKYQNIHHNTLVFGEEPIFEVSKYIYFVIWSRVHETEMSQSDSESQG